MSDNNLSPGPPDCKLSDQEAAAVLDRLYYLFGREAVFIPVLYGMKKAVGKWKRTWKETQTPRYQARLIATIKQGGNIAVILGPASGGVCAIDCDLDEEWRPFLAESPDIAGRLRTRGAHGGQVFFKMAPGATYPNSQATYPYFMKGRKEHVGEWRCGGGGKGAYSVIYGWQSPEESKEPDKYPQGVYYAFEVETPIALLSDFGSIPWRPNWEFRHPLPGQPAPGWEARADQAAAEADAFLNKRIQTYLDSCDPAISGQGGHNTTFRVACALVRGFSLGRAAAFRWLRYYNHKCKPPWSAPELSHKVEDALKAPHEKPPGYLLDEVANDYSRADQTGGGERVEWIFDKFDGRLPTRFGEQAAIQAARYLSSKLNSA